MKPEQQNIVIALHVGTAFKENVIRYQNGIENGRGNTPEYIQQKFKLYQAQGVKCDLLEVWSTQENYLNDLNAIHVACEMLDEQQEMTFKGHLWEIVRRDYESGKRSRILSAINATATQRAEAFLRTINKWIDEQPQTPQQ